MDRWKTRFGFPETQGAHGFLLVLIIDALGSGMYLPLSILYFQITSGFSLPAIGLTLTIATICTLPLTLLTGSLVDRLGARNIVASSQFIQCLGLSGYLFVHTIPSLFTMALLVTGGARMFYAAHTVLIVEIAVPTQRDRWYGLSGAIRSVGIAIGSFLVGLVLTTKDPDIYRLLIAFSALCYLAAGGLLLRLVNPRYKKTKQAKQARSETVLKDRVFLILLISNTTFPLCALMLGTALPIYLPQGLHAPAWILGPLLIFSSLLTISCQTLVVRVLEPHRRTRTIGIAALTWCISCNLFVLALCIPGTLIFPYLLLVVGLHTLASLIYTPTASSLVAELGGPNRRGRYLATYEFSWGVANALVPVLFTTLYAITPALPWLILAIMSVISGLTTLWLERQLPAQAVRITR
ncbi:MFS transporter [Dictyobacter aurantiacus]|uniref:MFS transporter n=1 Tax=Dictyobacter aurantiacus TaxID=1936993 RepID=A0A401ZJ38_9CHLR|nr:MFS transporter [Dictyobacter aurantiacus]GCE06867.1 MFS transporter [Dictyobacter aurantiacus]